jgi:tetratricopeptide (TPR) repeat protein
MKTLNIFVSSSLKGCEEERSAVKRAIIQLGHKPMMVEDVPALGYNIEETIKEAILQSDVVIVILGVQHSKWVDKELKWAIEYKEPLFVYVNSAIASTEEIEKYKVPYGVYENGLDLWKKTLFDLDSFVEEMLVKKERIGTFPIPPTPYFAHPYAMQKNFTGRVAEMNMLTDWLIRDPHPMLAVISIGGMGKSALAWYWLMEDILKRESQPEGVIWWSFYDKEASFESFLNHVIEYASRGEIDAEKIESTRDKIDFLYKMLYNDHFLLVLDGVERVLGAYADLGSPYRGDEAKEDEKKEFRKCIDPNCGMFLKYLATGYPKTKTLLTSRLFPKELDESEGVLYKALERMGKEDAVEFFSRQGVRGTRAEIEMACESVGYHPLSLRLLSGMIVHDMKFRGDVKAWTKHKPLPRLVPKAHHILALAYNSLDNKKQNFISRLSAFRNPMDYDAVSIFNDFGSEEKFNEVLIELVERGMLFRNEKSNNFGLHPIVRKYCYDRLRDKRGVHSKLRDYFAEIPVPEKIESVDDLAPGIELYHHTVRVGRYDEAARLFGDRLQDELYFRFGAYQTIIELLRVLFPDGEDKLPRLKDGALQAWALNELAKSYLLLGQPRRAVLLIEMQRAIQEKEGDIKNLAIGLGNLAQAQIPVGELDASESNLRRSLAICRETKAEFAEAIGHQQLGRLLAYRGKFEESKNELISAFDFLTKLDVAHSQCVVWAYRSIRSLLMSNTEKALDSAKKARELADVAYYVADIIQAEYLLGAAYLLKENLLESEKHLIEALMRDRKINLVEFEPDILLEFAKLKFKQNHNEEALKFANEALQIADRCEYRLKQADVRRFLAEFYLAAGDLEKAREHGEIARERAECGYKPALEKAEKLLDEIELR